MAERELTEADTKLIGELSEVSLELGALVSQINELNLSANGRQQLSAGRKLVLQGLSSINQAIRKS